MSQYTKSTNFATKDNLTPGDPLKVVRGTEIDTEFNNIATAVATKTDNSAAAITGGTITGITDLAVADGGTGASTAAGGLNNLLPSQTSNANKYLQTDGTNASWDAVTLSTADITGTLPVANGGTGVTSSTGTGSVVLSNSPTLVTPALGTPASGTLTNATGLPISTGVSGLGTGVATFLGTPSSANLISAVTDETGTGSLVFATSPTLVTPALGTPSALVGTNITGTASGLTAGNVTTNANLTGAVTSVGNATSLGSFTSSQLAGALTDETGSGANVFATSPTLVTPILGTPTSATLTNATGLPLTTGVTGTLPTANGGTNLTSFTSGGVVYASSTSALTTGSALVFDGSNFGVGVASPAAKLDVSANATIMAYFRSSGGSANDKRFTITTGGDRVILDASNNSTGASSAFSFTLGATEGMRLTSTGLGIGTSSPAAKLDVVGAIRLTGNISTKVGDANEGILNGTQLFPASAGLSSFGAVYGDSNASSGITLYGQNHATKPSVVEINTISGNKITYNTSGNLGLGVTPSAWGGSYKALQTPAGSLSAFSTSQFGVNQNAYDSGTGTFVYATTAAASRYLQLSGQHLWYNAASGTAGNVISYTQAMTLDASGNLGVGTTAQASRISSTGSSSTDFKALTLRNSSGTTGSAAVLNFEASSGTEGDATVSAAQIKGIREGTGTAGALAFWTSSSGTSAERARIDSSGNLLVGTTTTNNFGGTVVQTLGSSGIVDVSSASVAQNGTVNLTASSVGNSFTGFLSVTNFLLSNGNIRTQSLYAIMGRGTNFTATQLGTANGTTGGASFTVTCTTTGVITVTNTYAGATQVNMTFTGHKGG